MNVVINGLMTNYQKVGTGKVLVFLHGWGDDSGTFSEITRQLQSDYTVLTIDLPGFGKTQNPPQAWSLEDYARFVADWLKKIGHQSVEAIVGHSFGGAVAIKGISGDILSANKLILIASAGVRENKSLRKKVLWTGAKLGKLPLYVVPANRAKKIKKYLYKKAGSDLLLLPHMRQTFLKTIGEDLKEAASGIKVPTLLIYGGKDSDTPVGHGKLLSSAIPDSRLEIVEGTGHFAHQEQPGTVTGLIKDFLDTNNA